MNPIDANEELPEIDDQLIHGEQRYELMDGKLVYVSPADEPHGELHVTLGALLLAHRASGFSVALDMLTRTSRIDDIAPDASVYPTARHPETGRRQLDELSFEIASTQSLGYVFRKASKLSSRGVRRVFVIDLRRARALEWSRELGDWRILDARASLEDRCLAVPLPVAALLRAAGADDTTMRAMRVKRHPEFLAERAEGEVAGGIEALQGAVLAALRARAVEVTSEDETAIHGVLDRERLDRMHVAAVTATSVAAVLAVE